MKQGLMNHPEIEYASEWKRTKPDVKIYMPEGENTFDAANQHFLVSPTPKGTWFATWTRSADEGFENQHIACSRSEDRGRTWSRPVVIDGPEGCEDPKHHAAIQTDGNWYAPKVDKDCTGIASWCFPLFAPETGRIYVFYNKCEGLTDFRYDMSGKMCMRYSEDDGKTWSERIYDYPIVDKAIDNPDPKVNKNWIVWTQPHVMSDGSVIAPYSLWSSPKSPCAGGSESFFFHFENILTETDPEKFRIATYPEGPHGLRSPACTKPASSLCEEPVIVELSDGRLFCIMRTDHGIIYSSISSDGGKNWTPPIPLMDEPGGDFMLNPIVPCPLYKLKDGRYLLLYYNNDGSAHGGECPAGYTYFRQNRYPAYLCVAREAPGDPDRPLRFGKPMVFVDTEGIGIGPGGRTEAATYPSLLEDGADRILFYPDRKHWLLGKTITDEMLAEMDPGN